MFNNLKNILIVDDSPDYRFLFETLITQHGLSPICMKDGDKAIEYLKSHSVDVIITDFRMPKVDGIELLHWCRAHDILCPVIFTTAEDNIFAREELALGDCCATLMRKPVDARLLQAALEAADRFDHHRDCVHSTFKAA
ncbi:MAG: response regulator, partial [Chitinophagaceae bacterium]|nr:response regulator [Oligoflexus sp.]